jgi:circadian clock protein KaiB
MSADAMEDRVEVMQLELYVVGQSARSLAAIANLEHICQRRLRGRYQLTIVDVLDQPEAAEVANIVATPTLIRRSPRPIRRMVGDLSLTEVVLRGLGIEGEREEALDGGIAGDG